MAYANDYCQHCFLFLPICAVVCFFLSNYSFIIHILLSIGTTTIITIQFVAGLTNVLQLKAIMHRHPSFNVNHRMSVTSIFSLHLTFDELVISITDGAACSNVFPSLLMYTFMRFSWSRVNCN